MSSYNRPSGRPAITEQPRQLPVGLTRAEQEDCKRQAHKEFLMVIISLAPNSLILSTKDG